MTRLSGRQWKLIPILMMLAFAMSWTFAHFRSVRDRAEVTELLEKKKTVCAGRFLVDVPMQANVRMINTRVDGFQVDTLEESEAVFRARVAAREADIKTGGAGSVTIAPVDLVDSRNLHVMGLFGRSFAYKRSANNISSKDLRAEDMWVEAHAHTGGVTFTLSAAFTSLAALEKAEGLLARLRPRRTNEIPQESGFCVERGLFLDRSPAVYAGEFAIQLELPGHTDIASVLESSPGGPREYSLIPRVAGRDITTKVGELLRLTKLRKAMRSINGMYGEELLERVRELNFATTFGFVWASEGPREDRKRPPVSFEMQAGIDPLSGRTPADASLHEDAMLALWDGVVSSIRFRATELPGAPNTAALAGRSLLQMPIVGSAKGHAPVATANVLASHYTLAQPVQNLP